MDSMTNLLSVAITGVCSIIGSYLLVRRRGQETEVRNEVKFQKLNDRVSYLEDSMEDRIKNEERLHSMENLLIKIQKDIEYMKKEK